MLLLRETEIYFQKNCEMMVKEQLVFQRKIYHFLHSIQTDPIAILHFIWWAPLNTHYTRVVHSQYFFLRIFHLFLKELENGKYKKMSKEAEKMWNFLVWFYSVSQVGAFTHVPYIAQSSSIYVCKSKNKVLLLLCLPKNKVNGERSNWIANASQFLLKWERPCKRMSRKEGYTKSWTATLTTTPTIITVIVLSP